MRRIGPELKMQRLKGGDMKLPPFLSDLYFDLRDRRLLPLVALILVAIVATPILLSGGAAESETTAPFPIKGGGAPAAQSLTVVKAEPGLRNYKKRLAHRTPTNPFEQRFDAPQLQGGQLNEPPETASPPPPDAGGTGGGGSSGSSVAPPPSGGPSEAPSSGGGGSSGGTGTGGGGHNDGIPSGATFYSLQVTVQVTRIETKPDGSVDKKGPTLYKDIQAPAALPGEKTPVVTYLGMGSKNREPMFLVSNEVTGIFGEANCISGAKTCQLLVLEEGFPVTFVYGENDVRYKINLIKAEPIVTGHS